MSPFLGWTVIRWSGFNAIAGVDSKKIALPVLLLPGLGWLVGFQIVLWLLAFVLTVGGFAGLLLPALPGAVLIFAGLFAAAWAEDFAYVGWGTLAILGMMALLTYLLDFAATALGTGRFGGSKRAIVGASLGAIVGLFFGIIGVLLGPFVGAVLGELTNERNPLTAGRAGLGATLGLAVGAVAKLVVAISMVAVFVMIRLFGGD